VLRGLAIPAVVVITQAIERNPSVEKSVRAIAVPNSGVVPILAQEWRIGQHIVRPFGINELIETTIRLLPEAQRHAFIASQTARWDLKERAAVQEINGAAITAAATALILTPGGPSAALLVVQVGMVVRINSVLGLPLRQIDAKKIGGILGALATKMAGKQVFHLVLAEALRFFPGAGTAAGVVIGGPVGSFLTKMLGHLYLDSIKEYARRGLPLPSEEELSDRMERMLATNREHYANVAHENDPSA
jgi:uncharacterized protein (DUF697 family)